MKLINNSTRNYIAYDTILEVGKVLEVKDENIAKILLKQEGVEEYINKEDVKKLKEELEELKAQKPKEEIKEPEKEVENIEEIVKEPKKSIKSTKTGKTKH